LSASTARTIRVAIFGFGKSSKPPETGNPANPGEGGDAPTQEFSPEKAAKFFDRAKTVHETGNHEYAINMWLSGLRLDPSSMRGHEGFLISAVARRKADDFKKGFDKDTIKSFNGKSDVDRFLLSLLEWMQRIEEPAYAVRVLETGAKLKLAEPITWWYDQGVIKVVRARPKKDLFLKVMAAMRAVGSYDRAVAAGEEAVKADPSDGQLAQEVRSLAAQATMTRGGYDQSGQAGGFRSNIRDAAKQKALEDAEKVVKTEETAEQLLKEAKADHERRPDDLPAMQVYVKRLLDRGTPADETLAHTLLMHGYAKSNQFRLRQTAGEIIMRQNRRKLSELRAEAEKDPTRVEELRQAERTFAEQEIKEYQIRVENYPTDVKLKYELGRRQLTLGNNEDAIALFQEAREEPTIRTSVLQMLGQAFLAIDYPDEAVESLRQALEQRDITPEQNMDLRYFLLCALQKIAESRRDLAAAEESERLASGILSQKFNFKDVKARRDVLKKLVADLRPKPQGA